MRKHILGELTLKYLHSPTNSQLPILASSHVDICLWLCLCVLLQNAPCVLYAHRPVISLCLMYHPWLFTMSPLSLSSFLPPLFPQQPCPCKFCFIHVCFPSPVASILSLTDSVLHCLRFSITFHFSIHSSECKLFYCLRL